jgi:DNA-binding GntR family transcriptional regulator
MIHSVNDRAKLSCLRRNLYAKGEIQISLADHREIIDIFKEHDSAKASEKLMIHGRRIFNKSPENQVSLFFKKKEQ